MKKIMVMVLCFSFLLSLAGCRTKTTGYSTPIAGGADMPNNSNVVDTEKTQVAIQETDEDTVIPGLPDEDEPTGERMEICIDNIYYANTGMEVPIEPDDSIIEYVEIPVGGGVAISAFARIHEDNEDYLVCLIGEEWFKFIAE